MLRPLWLRKEGRNTPEGISAPIADARKPTQIESPADRLNGLEPAQEVTKTIH